MKTIFHIIGQPGTGKTTLVVALVDHFTRKGLSVGTIKHSSHRHELDKPKKDSHFHRTAGANPATIVTAEMAAIYLHGSEQTRPDTLIQKYYTQVDVVLIEGWISGPYPKIEIWRDMEGRPPLFPEISTVKAIVCNSMPDYPTLQKLDILSLNKIEKIADYILRKTTVYESVSNNISIKY